MGSPFLDASTVDEIREAAGGLLWDECTVQKRTASETAGPYQHQQWTYGEASEAAACKVTMGPGKETEGAARLPDGQADVLFDAAMEGTVERLDRLTWVTRYETPLETPITMDVIGEPAMTVLGLKVRAQIVPGEGN